MLQLGYELSSFGHIGIFSLFENLEMFSSLIRNTQGRMCLTRKLKKAVQLSQLFGLCLKSLSLRQNRLIFFIVVRHPHIPENHKTFEDLSIELLSIICYFKIFSVYI